MAKSERVYQAIQNYKKKFDNLSPAVDKAYEVTQEKYKILELIEDNPETTQEQWQKVLDDYEKAYQHYQFLDNVCTAYDDIVNHLKLLEEDFQDLENLLGIQSQI